MSSSLENLQPRTRVARIAPLIPAITGARARGIAWGQIVQEIGPMIGIEPDARGADDALRIAYRAAVRQVGRGRLTPEPIPNQTPISAPPAQPAAKPKPYLSEDHKAEKRPERTGFKHIKLS